MMFPTARFIQTTDLGYLGSVCLKYYHDNCKGCPFMRVCVCGNKCPKDELTLSIYRGVTSGELRAMADAIDELKCEEGKDG